jgi:molecular chaperone DnaJ
VCETCAGKGQVMHSQGFFMISTTCPSCGGAGRRITERCTACSGRGARIAEETLTVNIPAGVDDGQTLRLTGQGELPADGGTPGNLYVNLRVAEHARLKREGADVFVEVPISFATAALGGKISIPVIKGEQEIDVPAGTQPGEVLVLRGAGLPRLDGRGRGDQAVRIVVEVPKKIGARAKELLEQLAEELGEPGIRRSKSGFFERFQKPRSRK